MDHERVFADFRRIASLTQQRLQRYIGRDTNTRFGIRLTLTALFRKAFVHHVQLRTDIRLLGRAEKASDGGLARVQATLPQAPLSSSQDHAPTFLSTAFPSTLGYSSGWSVAYLTATVITGLWILSMWLMPVSQQVATHSTPRAAERQLAPEPLPASVGRITGMVDCQWNGGSRVSLGQKYDLPSGLMEITYDSGAKVILQGPVTYSVETNGGYLSMGKLTGKLEKRGDVSYPFAIHTPTATVTDLGTEFGVDVSEDGTTDAHVFVGEVRIATSSDPSDAGERTEVLRAGHSAHVGRGGGLLIGERQSDEIAKRFIRAMPGRQAAADAYAALVLSMNPVVYYRMEKWPRGKEPDTFVLVDSAPGGHHGTLRQDYLIPHRVNGRFGDALDLHGPTIGGYAIVDDYPKPQNNQLAVSVWVYPLSLSPYQAIVHNWWSAAGGPTRTGGFYFGLTEQQKVMADVRQRNGVEATVCDDEHPLVRSRWTHLAFVADGTMLHLYHDGVEVGSTPCVGVDAHPSPKNLSIGCSTDKQGLRPPSWTDEFPGRPAGRDHPVQSRLDRRPGVASLYRLRDGARPSKAAAASGGQPKTVKSPASEKGGGDKQ